ncbi:hypothetical protein RBSWK_01116 [Rhodopirellula baltica SWK14]|uniref:Uncharacterized protein n=1 Tax=Rhodopirellula baltica SWK14 TaxID=993516 RepID=L7CPX8_RHOBT|nr:hypothetical protein RBSWK_01116 [Rhodopirellula baltica SWK14]
MSAASQNDVQVSLFREQFGQFCGFRRKISAILVFFRAMTLINFLDLSGNSQCLGRLGVR